MVGYDVPGWWMPRIHLFVTHAVTNVGTETAHVANVARDAKSAIKADKLELVGDHA
jgi:hypothetical protein